MGTSTPDAVKRLVDRFSRDRKVFQSGEYKEVRLPRAETPHVPADGLRLTVYGLRTRTDAVPETLRSRWP